MKKKNALFDCLTYEPPVILTNAQKKQKRKEALAAIIWEKNYRRDLREKDIEAWAKYKAETKDKIKELQAIAQGETTA